MPDAAGHLLRLARYIEGLPPDRWQSRPTALAHHAMACLPFHQDTARFLNLNPRQFATLNFTADQADAVRLLRGLARARRAERRPPPGRPLPAGAPLPF